MNDTGFSRQEFPCECRLPRSVWTGDHDASRGRGSPDSHAGIIDARAQSSLIRGWLPVRRVSEHASAGLVPMRQPQGTAAVVQVDFSLANSPNESYEEP